ncbi:flagellar hook-associated protein 1 [Bryobacterales bacterium F-183]|nr:flagellar hook-associated protein 1 [Bryobacterales bacterium F-183]
MGSNLTITLVNTAAAQRAFDRVLQTIQNNVTNVHTPGWAKQRVLLQAQPFSTNWAGQQGGVRAGTLEDSRSQYAERSVRDSQSKLSYSSQLSENLSRLEKTFDLNSGAAIPQAFTNLFNSFSQLSVSPNNPLPRQTVIDQAKAVASSFNDTSNGIASTRAEVDSQLNDTVSTINSRLETIARINAQKRATPEAAGDPGVDAQMYAAIEELSQYVRVQTLRQADGAVNVYLADTTPLVTGDQALKLNYQPSSTGVTIEDGYGRDVTSSVKDGALGGLVYQRNTLIPRYMDTLNTLAKDFADRVNAIQQAGVTPAGTPPTSDIFTYNSTLGEAATLAVADTLTPDGIAAARASAPGGNGNALDFAALATDKSINNRSYTEEFGALAAQFGRDLSSARNNVNTELSLLSQAKQYREDLSGVDLNEAAAELIQFQRAYQASAEMFRILNQITETVLGLVRT